MKFLVFLLSLLFIFGCSTSKDGNKGKDGKYLSHDEVIDLFDEPINSDIYDEGLSEEDLQRLDSLIPMNELFSGTENLEIKSITLERNSTDDIMKNEAIDLRDHAQEIVSQWNGTCTAHATAAMVEGMVSMKSGKGLKLSERHLWNHYGKYNAYEAMKAMNKNYIAEDKYWPHKSTRPVVSSINSKGTVKIPYWYYVGDKEAEFYKGFQKGMIGKIAMRVPYEMSKCKTVIHDTSSPVDGGHDIAVYGIIPSLKHGLIAIIKQSWGQCGDNGYQYLQLSICHKKDYYCQMYLIDDVSLKD
jgi:hypothetical protein